MLRPNSTRRVLTALLPALLLTACASAPQPLPPAVVAPPLIPPLPAQARQTESPTHSQRWQTLVDGLLNTPTAPSSPGLPARPATTR